MFDTVYSFLSFTLYLLLCCTVLGLVLYYLAINPLAARVFYKISFIILFILSRYISKSVQGGDIVTTVRYFQ